MTRCAQCKEEKPDSAFSKSQLKKGADAKCSVCSAEAAAPASPSAPSAKVCAQCKRSDRQFSKAQLKKEDGRCVECVQSSEAATSSPVASSAPEKKEAPTPVKEVKLPEVHATPQEERDAPDAKAQRSESLQPQEDGDDGTRISCRSCKVFKPQASFENDSLDCTVCANAKKRGVRQTTMQDHGLVASDGSSYRRLSWVPENLKEYLSFMEREGQMGGDEDHGHEEDDDDGHENYYE